MANGDTHIRPATPDDWQAIVDIYNHYVTDTPATFDIEPHTVETRTPYLSQFADTGPYRLMVATRAGQVIGYAASVQYSARAAYDQTVMVSIFLHKDERGRGTGKALYRHLFAALDGELIHRLVAGITQPNPASEALHAGFGFSQCGLFAEVGFKFGRYWDVGWYERPFKQPANQ